MVDLTNEELMKRNIEDANEILRWSILYLSDSTELYKSRAGDLMLKDTLKKVQRTLNKDVYRRGKWLI